MAKGKSGVVLKATNIVLRQEGNSVSVVVVDKRGRIVDGGKIVNISDKGIKRFADVSAKIGIALSESGSGRIRFYKD